MPGTIERPSSPNKSVEACLRARSQARRLKENYEGTLGVPSRGELKKLNHLLIHDRDGVFDNIERLPHYNKSDLRAPEEPQPASPSKSPPRPHHHHHHHATHHHHDEGGSRSRVGFADSPSGSHSNPRSPFLSAPGSPATGGSGGTGPGGRPRLRVSVPAAPPDPEPPPPPPELPDAADQTEYPVRFFTSPMGAVMDPRMWSAPRRRILGPTDEPPRPVLVVEDSHGNAPSTSSRPSAGRLGGGSEAGGGSHAGPQSQASHGSGLSGSIPPPPVGFGFGSVIPHDEREGEGGLSGSHGHDRGSHGGRGGGAGYGEDGTEYDRGGDAPYGQHDPDTGEWLPGGGSEPLRPGEVMEGVVEDEGDGDGEGADGERSGWEAEEASVAALSAVSGARSRQRSEAVTPRSGATGASGYRSGSPTGSGSASEGEEESAERRKHRLAAQGLLHASELPAEEWARIGPPQDTADATRFTARAYDITIDWEPATLTARRVARPDIFHISKEEEKRRQMIVDAATHALKEQRRAEMEAHEAALEQERIMRSTPKGPRYDTFGVLRPQRPHSANKPRYLDWHPEGVGGMNALQQSMAWQEHEAALAQAGPGAESRPMSGVVASGVGSSGLGSTPVGSRVGSALQRSAKSETSRVAARLGSALPLPRTKLFETMNHESFVYEDTAEDGADGGGSVYAHNATRLSSANTAGTSRRVASATGSPRSFAPPSRPPGVTDAHYAQMVRQQRKWLNGPVEPPRPQSAGSQPIVPTTTRLYARPRSSVPLPEGTAPAVPSRVAAEAAAAKAAEEAAARPSSALRQTHILARSQAAAEYVRSRSSILRITRPQSGFMTNRGPAAPAAPRPWSAGAHGPAGSRPQSGQAKEAGGAQSPGTRPGSGVSVTSGRPGLGKPHVFGEMLPPTDASGAPPDGHVARKFEVHEDMLTTMMAGYKGR
ncbi:hypothetical protein HYH03_017225 [Edaphochlamys debaryana]|uniref:Uncharacterized protein n=1 Tax=Edaphochlamys debaryana TaxID=47281 RepID=A0A835XGZ2_9CHLO|nr:hypothetical protein HYH03_017225 [Edaphochlamys debaryana]|eukprot:KAG2483903.1 hypothetical protein HYH03_017225 [Edaphochlamys debaryana]